MRDWRLYPVDASVSPTKPSCSSRAALILAQSIPFAHSHAPTPTPSPSTLALNHAKLLKPLCVLSPACTHSAARRAAVCLPAQSQSPGSSAWPPLRSHTILDKTAVTHHRRPALSTRLTHTWYRLLGTATHSCPLATGVWSGLDALRAARRHAPKRADPSDSGVARTTSPLTALHLSTLSHVHLHS